MLRWLHTLLAFHPLRSRTGIAGVALQNLLPPQAHQAAGVSSAGWAYP